MWTVRKEFKFEAAHQLRGAYTKACTDSIHGHSYIVEVFLRADVLDQDDMVMDFSIMKDELKGLWEEWDHSLVLPTVIADKTQLSTSQKKAIIITKYNPTAEMMAVEFFSRIKKLMAKEFESGQVKLWKVRVHETRTGWAEYEENE